MATLGSPESAIVTRALVVTDFISGRHLAARPEEVDARQPFAVRLVREYGYPKSHIRTVPEVSIQKGSQVVGQADIVVFHSEDHSPDNIYIIVETKRRKRTDGLKQLKSYLAASVAQFGIWFNGEEVVYLQNLREPPYFREVPNIPRYGESVDQIGQHRREDLIPAVGLRSVFRTIYFHLYSNSNLPRAERLAAEVIRLIFCKIYDEMTSGPLRFTVGVLESPRDVLERISDLFEAAKREYSDVFGADERILLDAKSVAYVVGELQRYSLLRTDEEVVGDAFEQFLGPALRGEKGQFFTPRTVVRMCVDIMSPGVREKVIDPACGSGGFLIVALERIWREFDSEHRDSLLSDKQLASRRADLPRKSIFGIDKEFDLAKVTKAYMAIVGDGRSNIFNADTLDLSTWSERMVTEVGHNTFDVVLTNPPFGVKIPIDDPDLLRKYDLGHRWEWNKRLGRWDKTDQVLAKQDPQVLFLEKCLKLLRPGGRMAVVLPEGLFGNPSDGYVMQYVASSAKILAVVDNTRILFQPSTDTKTNVLFAQKWEGTPEPDYRIFMAVARKCGHNRRGLPLVRPDGTLDDDFPEIAANWRHHLRPEDFSEKGFYVWYSRLAPGVYVPRYYNPKILQSLEALERAGSHTLVTIGDLVQEGTLSLTRGTEIGSHNYGTGNIPFIRTSDISNWEINHDSSYSVSEEVYEEFRQELRPGDVFFIGDGRLRIGRAALLTSYDTRILVQSHLKIIRVNPNARGLTPQLLLYLLGTPDVRSQIQAKTFIQSTIATVGARIHEVVLPIPTDPGVRKATEDEVRSVTEERARLKHRAKLMFEGTVSDDEE